MPLTDYQATRFCHDGDTKTVYRRGGGPAVVIMHEIPGVTPKVIEFADRVVAAGFTVFMPVLFGTPNKEPSVGYSAKQLARACVSKEFRVLASRGSSPITEWLRALCRHAHSETGGPGVGALGMCITGNFALSLMVDESVMAPVLSQPSLPFAVTKANKSSIHVNANDMPIIKRRANNGAGVLGLRFTNDFMCPRARFEKLEQELGEGFEGIEIDSSKGNAHGIGGMAHSVLTEDLVDETGHPTQAALHRVLEFFDQRLKQSNSATA